MRASSSHSKGPPLRVLVCCFYFKKLKISWFRATNFRFWATNVEWIFGQWWSGQDMMKEKEQLAIQLMLKGESPKDAMTNSGCNYKNSSREYFKVYKRFTRKKCFDEEKRKGKSNDKCVDSPSFGQGRQKKKSQR